MRNVLAFHRPTPETSSSPEPIDPADLPPKIGIGGLLTVKRFAPAYKLALGEDPSGVPYKDRFIAPPEQGLCSAESMEEQLEEELEIIHDKFDGRKMYGFGHSLGALLLSKAVLKRPDMWAGVTFMGGVHKGIDEHTLAGKAAIVLLGNPKTAPLLLEKSDYMQEHIEQMANEWPKDVPVNVLTTWLDILVKAPQGIELELPEGQQAQEKLIVPNAPGAVVAARKTLNLPDQVEVVKSTFLTDHFNMMVSPYVLRDMAAHRRVSAGDKFSPLHDTNPLPLAA